MTELRRRGRCSQPWRKQAKGVGGEPVYCMPRFVGRPISTHLSKR